MTQAREIELKPVSANFDHKISLSPSSSRSRGSNRSKGSGSSYKRLSVAPSDLGRLEPNMPQIILYLIASGIGSFQTGWALCGNS